MKKKLLFCALLVCLMLVGAHQAYAQETSKALRAYVEQYDNSFQWKVLDSLRTQDGTAYRMRMQSQTWRGFPWIHEMVVIVPQEVKHRHVLLHVTGGSANKETGEPNYHGWDEGISA